MSEAIEKDPKCIQLEERLVAAASRLSQVELSLGMIQVLAWSLGSLLLLFTIDVLGEIPYGVRLSLWIVGLIYGVTWFIRHPWKKAKKKILAEEASLWVEKSFPELRSGLISSLQFQQVDRQRTKMSTQLMDSTIAATHEGIKTIAFKKAFRFALPKVLVAVTLGLGLFWLLLFCVVPLHVKTFGQRLCFSGYDYPTETEIVRLDWPRPVVEKQAFEFEVSCDGVNPPVGVVVLRDEKGAVLELELIPIAEGSNTYRAQCLGLSGPTTVSVELGDDDLSAQEVIPLVRPQLLSCEMVANFPAYTQSKAKRSASGSLRVLKGSTLTWQVKTRGDLDQLKVTGSELPTGLVFTEGQEPGLWLAELQVESSFSYGFELVDRRGVGSLKTPNYRITTFLDKAPLAKIKTPQSLVELSPTSKMKIAVEFMDDYGIDRIDMMAHVRPDKEQAWSLDETRQGELVNSYKPEGRTFNLTGAWSNEEIDCKAGDKVDIWFRVVDNAKPSPSVFNSSPIETKVISKQQYHDLLIQRLNEEMAPVNNIVTKLKSSQRELEGLSP